MNSIKKVTGETGERTDQPTHHFYLSLANNQVRVIENYHVEPVILEIDGEKNEVIHEFSLEGEKWSQLAVYEQEDHSLLIIGSNPNTQVYSFYYYAEGKAAKIPLNDWKVQSAMDLNVVHYQNTTYVLGEFEGARQLAIFTNKSYEVFPIESMVDVKNSTNATFQLVSGLPLVRVDGHQRERKGLALKTIQEGSTSLIESKTVDLDSDEALGEMMAYIEHAPIRLEEKFGEITRLNLQTGEEEKLPEGLYEPLIISTGEVGYVEIGDEQLGNPETVTGWVLSQEGERLAQLPSLKGMVRENRFSSQVFAQPVRGGIAISLDEGSVFHGDDGKQQVYGPEEQRITQENRAASTLQLEQVFTWENIKNRLVSFNPFITVFTTLLLIGILILSNPLFEWIGRRTKTRKIQGALANGGDYVVGQVVRCELTGVYINEVPKMLIEVQFHFEGKEMTGTYKEVRYLPLPIDSQVSLVYDPIKNKLHLPIIE